MNNIYKSRSFKWSLTASVILIICYAITWRFFAVWWLILAFVDLAVILLYLTVIIRSFAFWIINPKKFNYPFLPFSINIIAALIITISPSINRNKNYPKNAFELKNDNQHRCKCHLYVETYCVFGMGAWGGDINSLYLTDSVNFRKYIGAYDEEQGYIYCKLSGQKIYIEKREHGYGSSLQWDTLKVVYKKIYNINDLKEMRNIN